MSQRKDTALFIFLIVLGLGLITGLTWMNYQYSVQEPGGNDFLARWMGAHHWVKEGISPYSDEVSLATQQIIYGRPADVSKGEDINHFVYPLFSMLIFAPFGLLDYTLARALWMTLLEICLVLTAVFGLQLSGWKLKPLETAGVLLFSILWYPGVRTLILGQFAGVEAVLILGAFICIQKRHDIEAGLLLALSLSKPQMSFLIVIFTFAWALSVRRTRLMGGLLAGIAFLMAGSLIFLPDWPLQWIQQMVAYPDYTGRIGSIVSILAESMPGISKPLTLLLNGIFIVYLLFEWAAAWGKDERWYLWTALFTLVITNLVAFRTATPHFILLLPAFFLAFRAWQLQWAGRGQAAAWIFILILLVGIWLLFIATVDGNTEAAVMYLPIPFLSMIMLWWTRGSLSRVTLLPFEHISR